MVKPTSSIIGTMPFVRRRLISPDIRLAGSPILRGDSMRRFIALLSFMLIVPLCGCDSFFNFLSLRDPTSASWVLKWNRIAIDTSGLDHTPVQPGEDRTFGHQLGPGRSSRAMAIVHIAMFDSINAVAGGFKSYTNSPSADSDTSIRSAIAQAA